jgi:hypothetical protein
MAKKISQLVTRGTLVPATPTIQNSDLMEWAITGVGNYQLQAVDFKNYVADNLTPTVTDTKDVGANALKFRDGYFSGTVNAVTITATNLGGTLSTAAQPNVTSVGTLATLAVSGDFAINTNKFTVTAASGNTAVAGTLAVTGAATFSSTAAVTGNATVGGTLAVTGTTTLSAALTYGGVTLSNAVTGTGNMVLSASPTFTGTIIASAITASSTVSAASLAVGTAAASGSVRLPNNGKITARNAANTADFDLLLLTTSNELQLGDAARAMNFVGSFAFFNSIGTTASAANAFLDGGAANSLLRSTSSLRYKDDISEYGVERAQRVVFNTKAILFTSTAESDNPERHFVGFGAEQVWSIPGEGKRYVHLDQQGRPDGVAYASYVVPLTVIANDHERRLRALEGRS